MTDKEDHQKMSCPPPRTLADLRRAAGLTQIQVATQMGVNQSRVSQIEANYPNVQHARLTAYIKAIGGTVRFTGAVDIDIDQIVPDESLSRTRAHQIEASRRGRERQNPINIARAKSSAEELPLQGDQPEPGGDDPSREVDQPDTERDQSDGGQSEQP